MGYTVQQTGLLLGLGVSSISDISEGFAQNEKTIHDYYARVHAEQLPVMKGYFLNETDKAMRKYILDVACTGKTQFDANHLNLLRKNSFPILDELASDGLLTYNDSGLAITPLGLHFLRNICRAFDLKSGSLTKSKTYSQAI
jgi:oxygen-independent coproporphyrinogen-3 oxidase